MERISYRDLQRMPASKLLSMLPCGVTVDSQGGAIILSVEGYEELLKGYRQLDSQGANKGVKTETIDKLRQTMKSIEDRTKAPQRPSESLPLYNPAIHGPGDRVMVKPLYGKKLVETVIPELDAGGQPVPNYD